jgi:hypothetical protein
MSFEILIVLLSLGLFITMVGATEAGRRLGRARIAADPGGLPTGVGAAEGAVFGLLGLLLAFSFSGAASRFDERRALITEEANAIGTAWLRLEMLPDDARAPLQDLMRRYLDSRLATYAHSDTDAMSTTHYAESVELQEQIWALAIAALHRPDAAAYPATLALPALNDVFDIATSRLAAIRTHPPPVVYILLFALALIGALLVGYNGAANSTRSVLHDFGYALTIVLAIYVILDLEYPRLGLIRVEQADQLLIDLRRSMG